MEPTRKVETPKSDNTHSFTGEVLDILTYVGLDPAGLGLYYTITGLTKRDENNEAKRRIHERELRRPEEPDDRRDQGGIGERSKDADGTGYRSDW